MWIMTERGWRMLKQVKVNVTPPGYTPSLMEQLGMPTESTADQFCKAIDDYLAGKITYLEMQMRKSSKKIVKSWAKT